jgi:hypothetical protein
MRIPAKESPALSPGSLNCGHRYVLIQQVNVSRHGLSDHLRPKDPREVESQLHNFNTARNPDGRPLKLSGKIWSFGLTTGGQKVINFPPNKIVVFEV